MMISQFQFTNISDEEIEIIPEFGDFLIDYIYEKINTKFNRLKINTKIKYLYTVQWISWKKKEIDIDIILEAIYNSIIFREYKDNIWKIEIDSSAKIPNTNTGIDRFIRFLNYGDIYNKGMGLFTNITNSLGFYILNDLWRVFVVRELGMMTQVKIISDRS